MNSIVGKTFVNPKFLSQVVVEHSQMSLVKKESYSLSVYENEEEVGHKIYIFSQDHQEQPGHKLTIQPNRFKYGSFGKGLFLVKQK